MGRLPFIQRLARLAVGALIVTLAGALALPPGVAQAGAASVVFRCDCDGNGVDEVSVWINYEDPNPRVFGAMFLRCGQADLQAQLATVPPSVVAQLRSEVAGKCAACADKLGPLCPDCWKDVKAATDEWKRWFDVAKGQWQVADNLHQEADRVFEEAQGEWNGWWWNQASGVVLDPVPWEVKTLLTAMNHPDKLPAALIKKATKELANRVSKTAAGTMRWLGFVVDTSFAIARQLTRAGDMDRYAGQAARSHEAAIDALRRANDAKARADAAERACRAASASRGEQVMAAVGQAAPVALTEPTLEAATEALQATQRIQALLASAQPALSGAQAGFEAARAIAEDPAQAEAVSEELKGHVSGGIEQLAEAYALHEEIGREHARIARLMGRRFAAGEAPPEPTAASGFCHAGESPAFVYAFRDLADALGAEVMGEPTECAHAEEGPGSDEVQATTTGEARFRTDTLTATFSNGAERWAITADGALVRWEGESLDPPEE